MVIDQIMRNSEPVPESGCWIWTAAVDRCGYGKVTVNNAKVRAHRVSYEIFNGPIISGGHVLHTCDVRCCVNPAHLYVGTNLQNMRDKVSRKRAAGQVLTPDDVRSIRNDRRPTKDIAADYGISTNHVRSIMCRCKWSWV